ncbi:MAG: hypothetical protein K2K01_02950 [Eubacterium sp.]|nr:hypothetical protein [Eubacterium sp.]
MAEETKIKSSLFGYSKKSVDEAIEKLHAESNQKATELEAKLLQEQKKNAMLQMEIKMLQECNKDLEIKFNEIEDSVDAINAENAELKVVIKEQAERVAEAISEVEKAQAIISEKEIVINSIRNEKNQLDSDYTGILNTFNELKADITRSRIIIDEKDKQIETLNSKLSKYQMRYDDLLKKSDEISRNIINSGGEFDKKISELRECTNQMKLLIAEAEYTFNETSMHVSSFINVTATHAEDAEKKEEEKPKTATTEIHIS